MKTRLKAAGFALVGGLLGYALQPAPGVVPVRGETTVTTRTIVRTVDVPGPTIVKWLERQPTPHPTDCLVMRWTR